MTQDLIQARSQLKTQFLTVIDNYSDMLQKFEDSVMRIKAHPNLDPLIRNKSITLYNTLYSHKQSLAQLKNEFSRFDTCDQLEQNLLFEVGEEVIARIRDFIPTIPNYLNADPSGI